MTQEERNILDTTPRLYFDTRVGIKMKLMENPDFEGALKEVSYLRRLYEEAHPNSKELHEFVINAEYLLDRHGNTKKIVDEVPNKEECLRYGSCIIVEDFLKITGIGAYHTVPVEF